MHRTAGVSRGGNGAGANYSMANGGMFLGEGVGDDSQRQSGHITKNSSAYANASSFRDIQHKMSSGHSTHSAASRAHGIHGVHESNNRSSATSWRSTGASRPPANIQTNSASHTNIANSDDAGRPEWMDSDLLYDESQNARRMRDMEEWKRRMKENVGGTSSAHAANGISNAVSMQQQQQQQQITSADSGPARSSRFLRLFSANSSQNGVSTDASSIRQPLPAQELLLNNAMAAAAYANGMALAEAPSLNKQEHGQSGDHMSKLLKVFGSKISVSSPNIESSIQEQNGLQNQQPSALGTKNNALGGRQKISPTQLHGSISSSSSGTSAMSTPQAAPTSGKSTEASTLQISKEINTSSSANQRLKAASPAPINEALRGIVPTSVFRKSIQSSSAGNGSSQKRPESTSSSRSGTPARNLPSWLLELSRGRASPSTEQAIERSLITNASLGTQDLVDTLEREFPALSIKPQHVDNQSISSLSVQASGGVPSESNGGGSVRDSTIGVQEMENQLSNTQQNSSSSNKGYENTIAASGKATTFAHSTAAAAVAGITTSTNPVPAPNSNTQVEVAPAATQDPGMLANVNMSVAPGPIPSTERMHMQHALPPQALMGMPPPPHMMMPDGTMVPGMMHHHPSSIAAGQIPPPPPIGIMPPPHPHMGFHSNMMFGMLPPPPPHPGMFANMPPVNMSVGQMNGIPGSVNEHQQMMMKMMMMSDMPPGMVFGQMSAAPPQLPQSHMPAQTASHSHMYSAGISYPGMPVPVTGAAPVDSNNDPGIAQPTVQALQNPHQQQQPQ
ncbi:hypothetical protein GGI26_004196 [Coemansia sp. RSA 1358]|nr:hypothetical protein BX070DRAFT_40446 [Coemansia spiralis]KAJ1993135.1 hypothetical protein EDC05_002393 [Coemansia umbellata]KAJ2621319.1 hypothetical protein GGI26_004196 [Coemansia sp. RSA 1358]